LQAFNRRLDTLQAAVLRVKLKRLDAWNRVRRQHASLYNRLLADFDLVRPSEADYAESIWHLYVIRSANRDALQAHLAAHGIATGIHYPIPIHLQPAYRNLGYRKGEFPVTEQYAAEILSLPMYAELSADAIAWVAEVIREFALDYDDDYTITQPLVAAE
jgi:dTDP-4-amino-4,6-dideoxygalactose transaminase